MKALRVVLFLLALTCPAWTSYATTTCNSWDVEKYCCPAACAAKKESGFKENDVLRGCMRGIGCSNDESASATVFQMCRCP